MRLGILRSSFAFLQHKPYFIFIGFAAYLIICFLYVLITHAPDNFHPTWRNYNATALKESQNNGSIIILNFFAEWDLDSINMKRTVLDDDRVVKALRSSDVELFIVDLTGNNPPGNSLLKYFQRVGLPLLVVLDCNGTEVLKREFCTVDQLLQSIDQARNQCTVQVDS